MNTIIGWWTGHGTKILGTVASIVAGLLLVPDLIPKGQVRWWQAASIVLGVLTVKRGFTNSAQDNAQ